MPIRFSIRKGLFEKKLVTAAILLADAVLCGEIARMGADSVVRVTSRDGKAEYAKVVFELPVKPDWKVLSRSGEGLKAQNAWAPVGEGKTVPWYILLHDGAKTYGFGVKVQPRAMCSWRVEKGKIELLLDLRAAGQPLELGERTLEACEVVRCESAPAENAYATGRRLCALMCPHPRPLKEPMIGFNDWYAAYGRDTAKVFRAMLNPQLTTPNSQPTPPNSQLTTHNPQPCFSGIYPHLAMFNDEGECGTGATKVYVATMDNGLYSLDMRTLAVKTLQRDHNGISGKIWGARNLGIPLPPDWNDAVDNTLPGSHTKGMCSGFGRIQLANNGEYHKDALTNPWIPSGVLGDCAADGTDQRVIRRCQFTDITTADGIYGNEHPWTNPIWAMGWDAKSVIFGVTTNGTQWTYYRLPKASHAYDGAHGWNTEWPRIREAGLGDGALLATMHGTFWRFPRGFSPANPNGIRPISTYLKVIGDFCWWKDAPGGGAIVFGCDDQAKNAFLGKRGLKKDAPRCARSQSNLWFVKPDELKTFGPPSGEGYVWQNEDIKAGDVSDPYLHAGYESMRFSFVRVDGSSVRHEMLTEGDWVRVKCLEDAKGATARFDYGPAVCALPPLASSDPIAVIDDNGKKWHFPNVNGDTNVVCREIATERDLLYVGGVWYEVPAENAGGFAALRPVALADEPVRELRGERGLMYLNGKPMVIDDLWKNGTAPKAYWLWKDFDKITAPDSPSHRPTCASRGRCR